MKTKPRICREQLLRDVIHTMTPSQHNDRPAIRQAMNDWADSYRKSGHTVPDYAQDKFVRDVQLHLERMS